jgi:hypothetical protein
MACTSGTSLVCLVHLVSFMQPNKPDRPNRPNEQVSLWVVRQMMCDSCRLRKAVRDGPLRCRENHASQEACSGGGLGFLHDPFKVLFDGVFAQVDPVRDFFIGKSEHEINDDHLLAFG